MLSRRQLLSVLAQPCVVEQLEVCRSSFASVLKAKSSVRRKAFKEKLDLVFKNLCVRSADRDMYLARWKKATQDFEHESTKRSVYQDQLLGQKHLGNELTACKERLVSQRQATLTAEDDYGKLVAHNRQLESRIELGKLTNRELTERVKALEKQVKGLETHST